jgi:hypothetical protein
VLLISWAKMKWKVIAALVYAATTLSLWGFFDALYGSGPIIHHLGLIRSAISGAVLFAIACVISLFNLRTGIVCALVACLLCWPFFGGELSMILLVWRSLFSILGYSMWGDRLAAVLMLTLSSVYSLSRLRSLFQVSPAN